MALVPFDDRDGWIWLDGQFVPWREAKVHVLTHGLHYAAAVYEGVRMNGGAYGGQVADILVDCDVVIRSGEVARLPVSELGYSYRHSELIDGCVVVSARFRGRAGEPAAIQAEMDRIAAAREANQPLRSKTGGSTFKNPDGAKAWELVDRAGCRGLAIGGAQVSEKHTNFLINTGTATSADIEALGEEVRRRVAAQSGVELEWEIQRVGRV